VSAVTADQRLPDLTVWANQQRSYMHGWRIDSNEPLKPGRTLLRLTTAIANVGDGPLELRAGAVSAEDKQEVMQRIYDRSGDFTEILAGTFVYHPEHTHTHFDDFAQYNLRTVTAQQGVGDVVAHGEKVSFCLLDGVKVDWSVPGAAHMEQYLSCGQSQGISVGWADVYDSTLPDQWIDITEVPFGKYWLESVVDPHDRIIESDETNNATRILIELTAPPPDDFGNTIGEATEMQISRSVKQAGRIGEPGDEDVFSFTALRSGKLKVSQVGTAGNIDSVLAAFDGTGQLLSQDDDSAGGFNSRLKIRVTAGQTYYLTAAAFGGTTGDYVLKFSIKYTK
jgi:hypothetical protein